METDPDILNREFLARMLPSQQAIRNFIYSIHPHAGDLDDIMQDTALSLWEKFGTFDMSREFLPWANRLAYFEVLRFRKKCSRDRLVFSDELVEILVEEGAQFEQTDPVRQALETCLGKLDARARQVIEARYERGTSIAQLAQATRISVHRLYRLLESSRALVATCVRRKLAAEGHSFSP